MNIIKKSSVAALLSIFAMAAVFSMPAKAENNPFESQELMTIVAAGDNHDHKCGEGKDKDKKGKCGEGKCGEGKAKKGKCGEGKCGESKTKKCGG